MKTANGLTAYFITVLLLFSGNDGRAAASITLADDGGATNDVLDYSCGTVVPTTDALIAGRVAEDMIGATNGTGSPGVTVFDASRAQDRAWIRTPNPMVLTGYRVRITEDNNGTGNRGATGFLFEASSNGIDYTTLDTVVLSSTYIANYGGYGLSVSNAVSMNPAQFFRVTFTRAATNYGVRVNELDGFGASSVNLKHTEINTTTFNARSNIVGDGDDPPGLATNFAVSSIRLGTDTIEDAFGNADGGVEANTFIFENGGTADNGNGVMGDGGETVHWITWETTEVVTLAGYSVTLGGIGDPNRTVQLVRFSAGGSVVDLFDHGEYRSANVVARYFAAPVSGNQFKIEFTGNHSDGPRIIEIDAILSKPPSGTVIIFR